MVLLGIVVALIYLSVPIVVVVLLFRTGTLQRRIDRLEDALRGRLAADGSAGQADPAEPAIPAEPGAKPAAEPAARPAAQAAARPAAQAARDPDTGAGAPTATAPAAAPRPPRGPTRLGTLVTWLRENWVYAVSAVSLGLAGIFLVQYGVETGLLTPAMRVTLALIFGAALIVAGETIRRRSGDGEDSATAYLPSTFSGAGIVVLYAAILAARGLYGLIGPEMAFAGLVAISGLALVFGWFYGPFLAAAGLTGAAAAPFLVGGEAESGTFFYLYYGLLGPTALAIDAMRRWVWVSVLGLALAYAMGWVVFAQGGDFAGLGALVAWLAIAAIALPRLELWPSHPGRTVAEAAHRKARPGETGPIAPVAIAAGAIAASTALLFAASRDAGAGESLLALGGFMTLILALSLWAVAARGLADLALLPAAAFLLAIFDEAANARPLFRAFAGFDWAPNPEATPPLTVTAILGLAALGSAAFAWRSFRGPWPAIWAAGAALLAPVAAVLIELFWTPAPVIGGYFWAGHALALGALMTLFAERFARADGEDRRRAAYATLSALSLIALALFILLSQAALTVALSVLVVVAAALDRRFGLAEMRWFILAGIATLTWRLIVDPGVPAYAEPDALYGGTPLAEVLLAYGAAMAGLAAAIGLLPGPRRAGIRAALESGLWVYGGALASVLLARLVSQLSRTRGIDDETYWWAALFGLVWSLLALAQVYRLRHGGSELRWLRRVLIAAYGLMAGMAYLISLTVLNPFFGFGGDTVGIQPLDTLSLAYALPGLLFAGVAARAGWVRHRRGAAWVAAVFFVTWAFLEIRWFWRGQAISAGDFTQEELYSYTVALLITGGALLYQSIARASPGLRRLAMTVIGLTVAKVFLVDISGLTGLLRVFSFLALGLALAGLAWLNRWAAGRQTDEPPPPG